MSPFLEEERESSRPEQTNGHAVAKDEYIVPDTLMGTRRPIKVIVIGFGISGINISYVLGKLIKNSNITLQFYDKNPEVGGTWYENRYPGCMCDIPSVNYQLSWHPNPNWSSYYASHTEILNYLKSAVAAHQLDTNLKLSHKVTGAWWEADKARWKVMIQPVDNPDAKLFDYADVVINSTGVLNKWKWPSIPGLEKFKNKAHTAAWDSSIELTDKVIGIIGNGSSACQVTAATHDAAKRQVVFLRSPNWVTAGFASKYAVSKDGSTNPKYTDEQRERFRTHPEEYLAYRKAVEREMNANFGMFIKGHKVQLDAAEFSRNAMSQGLKKKPEIAEKFIPKDFAVGCRRPIPDHGYLEKITSDKCEVTFSPIAEITERGILTSDGKLHELDLLACGTGFDVTFVPRFPIIGVDGLDLREEFKDSPETYLSTMACGFPNYLMVVGPFGPYAHGSLIPAIEAITRNVAMLLEKFQTQNIRSFAPKKEAVEDFRKHREQYLERTVWNAPCSAWFKLGPKGENIMMWPGSRLHVIETFLTPRWEDYDWEYLYGNRFSYWGSGFTALDEGDEELDKAWYIDGVW